MSASTGDEHSSIDPPFAVQLEATEGCNLWCDFCGLKGIRKGPGDFKFADPSTAERIAREIDRLGWNPRIEFAMHGEPTMNPHLDKLIRPFQGRPVMVTSNGGGLLKNTIERVQALFDAGMDTLAIDAYEYVTIAPRLREAFRAEGWPFYEYPEDPEGNPHQRARHTRIVFIKDISVADKGTHSMLNNHAGAAAPPKVFQQRCAKPFRELSIRWDGSIAICCNDWRGKFKIGNILETPLDELWLHPRMMAARRFLLEGDRQAVDPCNGCDAKSYRLGLLPDKKGQKTLRPPNQDDIALVYEATRGSPLTLPVLREWEV